MMAANHFDFRIKLMNSSQKTGIYMKKTKMKGLIKTLKRLRRFFLNAVLLGATTIFMRSVAVVFNAYVSGKIGAEGMGLYSLITSVYGFAVTLATSGVSLAVIRLVS